MSAPSPTFTGDPARRPVSKQQQRRLNWQACHREFPTPSLPSSVLTWRLIVGEFAFIAFVLACAAGYMVGPAVARMAGL